MWLQFNAFQTLPKSVQSVKPPQKNVHIIPPFQALQRKDVDDPDPNRLKSDAASRDPVVDDFDLNSSESCTSVK